MKIKRLACGILAAAVWTGSLIPAFAANDFNDLQSDHWAYASVQELVADGTVKGYEDGGFHPDGTVTRAEFVKMIGKGATVRTEPYSDVDSSHWGYDYIMASGLKTEGNTFLPDQPIKRGEVLELIWSRNGSVQNVSAPSAITKQCTTPAAAAWGYTYGIMIGDDGFNLRLDDPLTRAEAAALIVRGRNYASATPRNFSDTVSDELLRCVLKGSTLFVEKDVTDLSQKITNGELAMAAIRLMYGEDDPAITTYPKKASKCKYGKQWAVIASDYLGVTDYSEEMVNKPATLSHAVAALTMTAVGKAKDEHAVKSDANGYAGVAADGKLKLSLSVAKGSGIEFNADGSLDAGREVTLKDAGIILAQLDSVIGLKRSYKNTIAADEEIQKDLTKYPTNFSEYPVILKNVPTSVYEAPSTEQGYTAEYKMAREFYMAFSDSLSFLGQSVSKNGYKITFTYYPSLVRANSDGYYTLRVYMSVAGSLGNATFKDIFGSQFTGTDAAAHEGFLEVKTATPLNSLTYPPENWIVTQVIL